VLIPQVETQDWLASPDQPAGEGDGVGRFALLKTEDAALALIEDENVVEPAEEAVEAAEQAAHSQS
jgi:hypothetical protein